MKKLTIMFSLALAVALFTTPAHAQRGFVIGVTALPQTTWMINNDDSDDPGFVYVPTVSAAFGLSLGYNFSDKLGIGADVLYSMQGQRYERLGKELYRHNDYLKIPLMLTFNSDPSKGIMFLGKIGPQLSLLTDSYLSDNDGNDIMADTKEMYESMNIGGMLSAGLAFNLSANLQLTTALRFDLGLANAENSEYILYPAGRADTYNATGGLDIGLRYIFK